MELAMTVKELADELLVDPEVIRYWASKLVTPVAKLNGKMYLDYDQVPEIRKMVKARMTPLGELRRGRLGNEAEEGSLWWRIERASKGKRMTLQTASKRMRIDANTLSKYKRAGVYPSVRKLILVADYLNVSVDYLVGHQVREM